MPAECFAVEKEYLKERRLERKVTMIDFISIASFMFYSGLGVITRNLVEQAWK